VLRQRSKGHVIDPFRCCTHICEGHVIAGEEEKTKMNKMKKSGDKREEEE
jgi:hypothetical protein